jgi:hypothetical protein
MGGGCFKMKEYATYYTPDVGQTMWPVQYSRPESRQTHYITPHFESELQQLVKEGWTVVSSACIPHITSTSNVCFAFILERETTHVLER